MKCLRFDRSSIRPVILVFAAAFTSTSCTQRVVVTTQTSFVAISGSAVNINTASAEELEKIPRVGPKLANEIISFRARHGRFRRVEHLMLIRGFSDTRYREVRDFVKTQ